MILKTHEVLLSCDYKKVGKNLISCSVYIKNNSKDTFYIIEKPLKYTSIVSFLGVDWGGAVGEYDASATFTIIPFLPGETLSDKLEFRVPSNIIKNASIGFSFLRNVSTYINIDTINSKTTYKMNYNYFKQNEINRVSGTFSW